MVPDEMVKERRFKSATGPGLIIEAKGQLKKSGERILISSVTLTIAPVEAGSGLFRIHKQVARLGSRRPSSTYEGPYRTMNDAKRMAKIWLNQYVTTVERPPPKIDLIELGRYYQGGSNNEFRRIVAISGEMVHYACWAGMGACRDYSFASWMKKRVDEIPPEEIKRIDARYAEFIEHGREEYEAYLAFTALGEKLAKSLKEERTEQDDAPAFSP